MSLILAVEPDRRQAAHLTHIVRQRVGAELILADTTELALASIGNRVPDLILVPPLLSPTDDAALAAALRVIATAAHVQMLTTPLFASAAPAPRRGVLAAFRRSKPKAAAIDGCDPAEFAQQISSYLESAAEKRATAQIIEPSVAAPAPQIAESSQRYVPLEAGRLYRDEAVAPREIEARPIVESVQEAVPEAEPLFASSEPEPVFTLPEPEPVFTLAEPEPVAEIAEPVVVLEAAELYEDEPAAIFETAAAVDETPYAAILPEPVATLPEPIVETPQPALETLEAVAETAEPFVETLEPIAETLEPVAEMPASIGEEPQPLASTYSRRIGFIVRDLEPEPDITALVAEPLDVEAEPLEIAASIDTADVVEAIAAPEPVATFAEPALDESIQLFEIVDEDSEAVATIDLTADFEDLQVLDVQSDVELISPIDAVDEEPVEIAVDSDGDAIEILETPELVEPFEPLAPQPHAIRVDPLQEFAAALEAMTATEQPVAIARQSAAAETIEFDDLFPPRLPVEPSPLGAWRSWTTLEGMAAEDAPVPAYVVERAVERAPERPDWVQLVESLRIDVERRRSEQPSAAPKTARKAPPRPVQDEWGLFDPAQCGFAALLNKLDEITDANDSRPRRSA